MSKRAAQVDKEVEEILDEASDDSSVEAVEEASHDLPPQAKRQRRFYDNKHQLEGERNGRYGHVDLEIKYLQEEYTGALIPKETFKKYVCAKQF
jgi:regulator of protease activity HflC (stomatin/prohibitin superfamily)